MIISYPMALEKFGPIAGNAWADESKWCVVVNLNHPPFKDVFCCWINSATGKPVTSVYCNVFMKQALEKALQNIIDRDLVWQLKTFDGTYHVRAVRGEADKISTHAFALAIDINADTNKLGTDGDISDELAACFTDEGFSWGKHFKRKDPMHFSFAWE